jgi:5-methyltetrahydrofolate--homocysteine methyltransferase
VAAETAGIIEEFADSGLVNLVGGCCGTTPAHIAAIRDTVSGYKPRVLPTVERRTRLAGIEPMILAA